MGGNFLFTDIVLDKLDNVTKVTDPNGQVIDRTFDDLSRLTRIATPDNVIDFTYDAAGNLLTVTDNDSSVARTHDGLDRVITQQTLVGGIQPAVTLTNAFDAVGNRVSLTDTEGGVTQFGFDAVGRLVQLITPGAGTIDLGLDAAGRRSQIAFPNGVATDFQYDLQDRLSDVTHSIGVTELAGFGYTYSAVGNILAIAEQTGTRDFTYDALQRLTAGGFVAAPESYGYDAVGNRTTSHLSATHVTDSANRLTEDDAFTYTYDDNGNLTAKTDKVTGVCTGGVTAYGYDIGNKLIQIDFPDFTTATYRYDGLGRRIEKDVDGVITRYVYDGENILLEYDGTNTLLARYSHGQRRDKPFSVERGGQSFFYQADHQGSVTQITDAAGFVVNSYEYDSYGRIEASIEGIANPFTYTGREEDPESGLYYYRARYYDPENGRFLSGDPLGFGGGDLNLYRYVLNNPLNLVDPDGEFVVIPVYVVATVVVVTAVTIFAITGGGNPISDFFNAISKALSDSGGGGDSTADADVYKPGPDPDSKSRGKSDEYHAPASVNPGKDCDGNCNPCPEDRWWESPGDAHGSTGGKHWTGITWNQNPATCECFSNRESSGTPPPGGVG